MRKIATSVVEQIALLTKRGMVFDIHEDKVKEVLLDIGYYRLGFYWNPFEINEEHDFAEGTKFSDVLALYYFDVDLRNLLLKFLNRVEINFKTSLIYYASNRYKENPTWFIDSKVIKNDFIQSVDKFYSDDFKKNNKSIKKHHLKYLNDKYAPAWKTLEFFTFGTILKIYASLKNEDLKKEIASVYAILDTNKLENHLKSLIALRNCCAHGSVIFDLKLARGISNIPALKLTPNERNNLSAILKVLYYYLEKISPNRKDELSKSVEKLIKTNTSIRYILEDKSGIL